MQFERVNAITGDVASRAEAMTVDQVSAIAETAARGHADWAAMGPNARRAVLMKAANALEARKDDFVAAMMNEVGATAGWAMFNLMLAAGMVREAASITTQINGEVIPSDKPGCLSMALREPVGVILGIAPWNAPIILGVRAIAVPLACGNSVILKASEACPRTHALIIEAFAEAGFPNGVINVVTNAPEDAADVVGALIDHPAVKRINFTGSTAVGRIIAKRAAEHLKPCLLELGGKAPMIILEDADLDEAVKAAAFGAFMNQGQICMSTERIIVVEAVADAFAEKFAAKAKSMPAGDPREGNTPLGAVVDRKAVAHVNSLIEDAERKGANILSGGVADSVIMAATVVDKVTADMNLYRDESFGPVVAMIRAKNEAEAIRLANDSEYGLAAGVLSADKARAMRVADQLEAGITWQNCNQNLVIQAPWGGVKQSGMGRELGRWGLYNYLEPKQKTRWLGAGGPGWFA